MVDSGGNPRGITRRRALVAFGASLAAVAIVVSAGSIGAGGSNAESTEIKLVSPRVVVLKSQRIMHLFDGDALARTYPIDLGTSPVGQKLHKGDGRTPVGTFHVVTKNAASPFHRFLGLDYPGAAALERGLRLGLISTGEAAGIRRALAEGRCPDWGTALGGGIGIHGRRRGEDWTAGCIALADADVEELFSVLRVGDVVEILP